MTARPTRLKARCRRCQLLDRWAPKVEGDLFMWIFRVESDARTDIRRSAGVPLRSMSASDAWQAVDGTG